MDGRQTLTHLVMSVTKKVDRSANTSTKQNILDQFIMKLSIFAFVALASFASGFAPTFTRGLTTVTSTTVFSEPAEEEEEGLDLDLGEMFDM